MYSAASVTENICPGTIPNGFLEHQCVRDPLVNTCFYTCADGFMKLNFRPVHRRDTLNNYHTLECVDGVWTTGLEHVGFRLQDICVPEGNFTHATVRISDNNNNNNNNIINNNNNNIPHLYSALFIRCSKALYIHQHNTKNP